MDTISSSNVPGINAGDIPLARLKPVLKPGQVIGRLLRRHGVSYTFNLDAALVGNAEFYIWHGNPKNTPGSYWIPALFRSSDLPGAVVQLMREEAYNRDEAAVRMHRTHEGLGSKLHPPALNPWAYVEIDHLGFEEQLARYAALSEATGIRFCLLVHSGGKSVHAYIAFAVPLASDDPRRLRVQSLLIAILDGDTKITDSARLMRLPAHRGSIIPGDRRDQPVLLLDEDAAYDPDDMIDRLERYATSMGIAADRVDAVCDVLNLAELLGQQANRDEEGGQTGVADDLRDHATLLRATKAEPEPADVRVAHRMIGRKLPGDTRETTTSTWAARSTTGSSLPVEWIGLTTGRQDACPWCGTVSSRVLSVKLTRAGLRMAHCFSEGVTRYEADAGRAVVEAEPIDLDALLGEEDGGDATDEPDDEDVDLFHVADARFDELEEAESDFRVPVLDGILDDLNEGDHLDDGETLAIDDSVRCSPYKEVVGTTADKTTEKTGSTEPALSAGLEPPLVERTTLEAGRSRFEDKPIWCGAGKRVVAGKAGRLEVTRTPCNSFRCSVCGPRQVDALRAASWAIVGSLKGEWRGVVFELGASEGTVTRGLRRWHKQAPDARHYIGAAIDPETVTLFVLWRWDDDSHIPKTGLRRHLVQANLEGRANWVDSDPELAVDALFAGVDRPAWGHAVEAGKMTGTGAKKATVLRGDADLRARVGHLRDLLLGRSRARKKEGMAPSRYVPTDRMTADIKKELGHRARNPLVYFDRGELAAAMARPPDGVHPVEWVNTLDNASVGEADPDDLGTVTDGEGVEHQVKDDGIDPRTRSRVHRFELRNAGGLTAEDVHATMARDGFYRKEVRVEEMEGAVGFVDWYLAAK